MMEVRVKQDAFGLFPYLHEDLKLSVLSFVADAPFESLKENYPKSALTHSLPQVNRKFRSYCQMDCYWKQAIVRQVNKEPFLWKEALNRLCVSAPSSGGKQQAQDGKKDEETADLVERAHIFLGRPSYKSMYQAMVSNHLRFKGPVAFLPGHLQLGQFYRLHLVEPRYKLLIAEVMKGQSEEAKRGGYIPEDKNVMFIHANRTPLTPSTPAVLVRVVRCELLQDGRADVMVMPLAHAWLERLWMQQPCDSHLYYAQCLRMPKSVTNDMNTLVRREALALAMDRLAQEFNDMNDDDFDDDDDDDDMVTTDEEADDDDEDDEAGTDSDESEMEDTTTDDELD